MHYTKTPNEIYAVMDDMSNAELRVTLALVRETYGYHRESCTMTYADFQAYGLSSPDSIRRGIAEVLDRKFFVRGDGRSEFAINTNTTEAVENEPENTTVNVETTAAVDNETTVNVENDAQENYGKRSVSSYKEKAPKGAKKKKPPPTPPPDPELAAMVNALVDATGVSARLNWPKMSDLARELLGENYTAAQVAQVYAPGGWWFTCDWRGQKGQLPGLTAVRETIRQGVIWDGQVPARASPNGHQPAQNTDLVPLGDGLF